MKEKYYISILVTIVFTAALFADIPEWVKNNSHSQYPATQYFLGIGISENRSEAQDQARANLIKEISVKIESELENRENEIIKDGKVSVLSQTNQEIRTAVSANLVGVRIAELEKRDNQYFALAILSKMKYFTTLEIKMDEISQQVKNLVDDSNSLQEEGHLITAIKNYKKSEHLLNDYAEKSGLYSALTGRKYNALDEIDSAYLSTKIHRIPNNTVLKIYRGENQKGISGTKLPETVIVKVIYKTPLHKEVPVQQMPIRVNYDNGEEIETLKTDSDGKISVNITAVPTDETGKEGRVVFKTHFPELAGEMKLPETYLTYEVKTASVKYQVNITHPGLRKRVINMITENGYQISDSGKFIITAMTTIDDEKTIESPFGTMVMVKATANLQMTEQATGNTIASMRVKGRATGKSSDKAQQSAINKVRIIKKDLIAFLAKAID